MDTLPAELLGEITVRIKGDFIAWTSTCKTLQRFNTVSERKKRSNHLTTLLPCRDDPLDYLPRSILFLAHQQHTIL